MNTERTQRTMQNGTVGVFSKKQKMKKIRIERHFIFHDEDYFFLNMNVANQLPIDAFY